MKKIIVLLIILFWLHNVTNNIYAENIEIIDNTNNTEEKEIKLNIFKNVKRQISVWEKIKIDFTKIAHNLNKKNDNKYDFSWEITGKKEVKWTILEISFETFWEKSISLKIFDKQEKKVVFNKENEEIKIFVYQKAIPFIFSKEIEKYKIDNFINRYKLSGTLIYNIWNYTIDDIALSDLLTKIEKFDDLSWKKADFIWLWWWKDFISSIFSRIELDKKVKENDEVYSFLAISDFNIKILDNYLNNFIANKKWLKTIIIWDENILNSLDKKLKIDELEKFLIKNGYKNNFQNVKLSENKISKVLFISKFVNNLSSIGFDSLSIYIFILFPFLLTLIGFIKHFIGFSTLWIVIPSILILIFFKFWFLTATIFFFWFIFFNIILAKIFTKYILLYTPKTSMILIINIVIFILVINMLFDYNLISLNLNNIFYMLLFIVISERIISIVLSKEFWEYKSGIFNTYFVALFIFLIFSISYLKIFLLAFPEIILVLIPINFLIWKFTGLRVTEYFRFKEVIKNMEE